MRRYRRMLYRSAACLIGAALLLASCEKSDNNTEGLDVPDNTTRCLLQPPTIGVMPFGAGSPATRAAQAIKEEQQAFNVGEELGNIITLGNSPVEETPQTRTFAAGTYYRIVIYTLANWNSGTMKILEQRLCKTGSTAYFADLGDSTEPIFLGYGSYKIFCYSFKKTTTDKMDPLADGTLNVSLSDGDDFMSTIVDKTIASAQLGTSVSLGTITLQHQCSQLIGILTAEAFNGNTGIATSPAPTLSAVSTFTTQGNWSIKGSSFAGTATASQTKAFTLAKSGNDYKGIMVILPLTSKPLKANYNFKPTGSNKNITASNKSVHTGTTFSSGGSYSFTIKAIGAYVLTNTNPVQIGSYKWAYANLNNNKRLETYPWVSGKLNGSDNDYWRWSILNIDTNNDYGSRESAWSTSTDPCRAGLGSSWKVPPKANFDNLVGYKLNTKKVYINGVTAITNSYGWVSSGTVKGCVFVDTSRGTCIFLPAAGNRNANKYSETGTHGYYWSNARYNNNSYFANALEFGSGICRVYDFRNFYGHSLRCSQ